MRLFELGGNDGVRYSQFSWRIVMALAHKGLRYESVSVRVSDKAAIAFSGQDKVPILMDGDRVITDSWRIAEHLEDAYPDKPSLFGGATGRALARFVNAIVDRQLVPRLAPLLMIDVLDIVDRDDAAHLRAGMERAFRKSLEELTAAREAGLAEFRRALDPARATLRTQPFLSGAVPAYADYILFSLLQWARIVSAVEPLAPDDAIAEWRTRMLDLFGGLARMAPARTETRERAP